MANLLDVLKSALEVYTEMERDRTLTSFGLGFSKTNYLQQLVTAYDKRFDKPANGDPTTSYQAIVDNDKALAQEIIAFDISQIIKKNDHAKIKIIFDLLKCAANIVLEQPYTIKDALTNYCKHFGSHLPSYHFFANTIQRFIIALTAQRQLLKQLHESDTCLKTKNEEIEQLQTHNQELFEEVQTLARQNQENFANQVAQQKNAAPINQEAAETNNELQTLQTKYEHQTLLLNEQIQFRKRTESAFLELQKEFRETKKALQQKIQDQQNLVSAIDHEMTLLKNPSPKKIQPLNFTNKTIPLTQVVSTTLFGRSSWQVNPTTPPSNPSILSSPSPLMGSKSS